MKFNFNELLSSLLAAGLLLAAAGPARACLICEDKSHDGEEVLRHLVAEKGEEAIPQLREIVLCEHPEHQPQKILAIETLAAYGDEESVPLLKKLVLELRNPASLSAFGMPNPEAEIRAAAARALRQLEAGGIAPILFADWSSLSPDRRRELPRLIGELAEPETRSMLEEIIRNGTDRETVFQAIIQMRRLGGREQVEVVRERLDQWEEEYARLIQEGKSNRNLYRRINYARRTIRLIGSRR